MVGHQPRRTLRVAAGDRVEQADVVGMRMHAVRLLVQRDRERCLQHEFAEIAHQHAGCRTWRPAGRGTRATAGGRRRARPCGTPPPRRAPGAATTRCPPASRARPPARPRRPRSRAAPRRRARHRPPRGARRPPRAGPAARRCPHAQAVAAPAARWCATRRRTRRAGSPAASCPAPAAAPEWPHARRRRSLLRLPPFHSLCVCARPSPPFPCREHRGAAPRRSTAFGIRRMGIPVYTILRSALHSGAVAHRLGARPRWHRP